MQEFFSFLSDINPYAWLRAAVTLLVGLLIARILASMIQRTTAGPMGPALAQTLRRVVFYGVTAVVMIGVLNELGFSLGILLGAAGVLSVAVGFASQTSASNLVSGIFLVVERPFELGDVIRVSGTLGEVLSIDLLSVKLRTFDNLYVRLPNETLIKSEITNLSRFPIRRFDLQIGVAYKEDIGRVRDLLIAVADQQPVCLDQPRPLVLFKGFGESSLDLQLSVWAKRENYLELVRFLPEEIKKAFDREGVEIPFPHRSLYTGSVTDPFPVKLVEN